MSDFRVQSSGSACPAQQVLRLLVMPAHDCLGNAYMHDIPVIGCACRSVGLTPWAKRVVSHQQPGCCSVRLQGFLGSLLTSVRACSLPATILSPVQCCRHRQAVLASTCRELGALPQRASCLAPGVTTTTKPGTPATPPWRSTCSAENRFQHPILVPTMCLLPQY